MRLHRFLPAVIAAACVSLLATAAAAQKHLGDLHGRVIDTQGAELPGVTVTLNRRGATQIQVTEKRGKFRFLHLAQGDYTVKAELEGFSTVDYSNIGILPGRRTNIEITLSPAIEEVITVTSPPSSLDPSAVDPGVTVDETELAGIPSLDPWTLIGQLVASALTRLGLGDGDGRRTAGTSPGSDEDRATWALDGIVFSGPGSLGGPPGLAGLLVSAGGSDAESGSGGPILNLITKRGTNHWRFEARYLALQEGWQSDLDLSAGDLGEGQDPITVADRHGDVEEFSIEGGGRLIRERLWMWGSFSDQEIARLTLGPAPGSIGQKSETGSDSDSRIVAESEGLTGKINTQLTAGDALTAFHHRGDMNADGRGAGPTRPRPTTWLEDSSVQLSKLEATQVFFSNFYLTGLFSLVDEEAEVLPLGGGIGDPTAPNVTRTPELVWQDSFRRGRTDLWRKHAKADSNFFFDTGPASHELRFGVG